MLLEITAILGGLALLVWSAGHFVEGAAATARHAGMPPLLIGMVVVGFGTSAPEMLVSALAAIQGNPGLALGNAYGSNITNIALILGLTALISPIIVQSQILRKELPILAAITLLAIWLLLDETLSHMDAWILLGVFASLMGWSIQQGLRHRKDNLSIEVCQELEAHAMPLGQAITWLLIGLLFLVASSRLLVWGAVSVAQQFGISDLIIGLTIVAVGTSLPELASSIVAARKNEHDIALGNIIGSNLFNTLAVVGIAGSIHPLAIQPEVLTRDLPVMAILTLSLFIFGYGFRGPGRINRFEGAALLASYLAYNGWLMAEVAGATA
jgi:cation:H+ antiporter